MPPDPLTWIAGLSALAGLAGAGASVAQAAKKLPKPPPLPVLGLSEEARLERRRNRLLAARQSEPALSGLSGQVLTGTGIVTGRAPGG